MSINKPSVARIDSNFLGFNCTARERREKGVVPYKDLPLTDNSEMSKVLSAVVRINSKTDWIFGSDSSGFLISPDGLCLASAHSIKSNLTCAEPLLSHDGKHFNGKLAKVIKISDTFDLALLKLKSSDEGNYLRLSEEEFKRGDFAYTLGINGFTIGQLLIDSNVKGTLTHVFNGEFDSLITTNPTSRGDSGCALVNSNGNVIGTLSGGLGEEGGFYSALVVKAFSLVERLCGNTIQTPFRTTSASTPTRKILDFLCKVKQVNIDKLLKGEPAFRLSNC